MINIHGLKSQDEDCEDDLDSVPEADRGVNEDRVSFNDPEIDALEQEALERVMLESAKLYNVTAVLKVK